MNKSQLRLLAAEVADARMPAEEYRARRRELIDSIVAGTASIVREQAPRRNSDEHAANPLERISKKFAPLTRLPSPILLAAGSLLGVAALFALLWPEPDQSVTKPTPLRILQTPEVSHSRALVEAFVARRDFDTDSIDNFQRDWLQIDAAERENARNELWFGALVRALREEISTQNALAGLSGGEAARARAATAFALGEFLGVSGTLPRVDILATPSIAAPDPEATTAPAAGPTEPALTIAERESLATPRQSATTASAPAALTTAASPTVQQWLVSQDDEQLTLQIFAVDDLDGVEKLIAAHPDLAVHVLPTQGAVPRYRILYGVFADEARARQAYAALPDDVTTASDGAIVKSFSAVRDDLRAKAPTAASAPTPAPAPKNAFTLQVFATGNRDSAQALVRAFPTLKLQVREASRSSAPYRVIYGSYASVDEARAAASALPKDLIGRLGKPLPRSVRSMRTMANP